ncbi:hypothetical protein F4808DRAFT_153644 [Astrocystis sublimbata]|nr:hypothetical protein F4808DRAFT_153644 [Astrocystis sublimbata]
MPTPESFLFSQEDEQLIPGMLLYAFPGAVDDSDADPNEVMKEPDFRFPPSEGASIDTMFPNNPFSFDQPPEVKQASPSANMTDPRLSTHRGSTSSSSMQSGGSLLNSPGPAGTSPAEWLEDSEANGNFIYDDYVTFDSPAPVSQSPPQPNASSDVLPHEFNTNKRRKVQLPSQPMKTKAGPWNNTSGLRSSNGSASIPAQTTSAEPSPTAVYNGQSGLSSPSSNFDEIGGNLTDAGGPMSWVPAPNGQAMNSTLMPSTINSTYISLNHHNLPNGTSPANQGQSNGNPPTLFPHTPLPRLVIHPMPTKSRVETQIPLTITLHHLPKGIKRVHLPSHTIAKPKLLEKSQSGPSPDMLELSTLLVCASAMMDSSKLKRAYARAAGHPHVDGTNSPVDGLDDEQNKAQNGGEVRICRNCINRERKRAGRKKHKKPEEEELWDRHERERAIVFNTNEVKDWQTVTPDMADPTGAGFINGAHRSIPEGIVQVDAPMRIACYCRHHSEKVGFQVIITLKDHTGNVVAQGISSSIMITDDHKTLVPSAATSTAPPPPPPPPPPQQQQQQQQPSPQNQQSHPPAQPQPLVANGLSFSSHSSVSPPIATHPTPIQPKKTKPNQSFRPLSEATPSLPLRHAHSASDMQSQVEKPLVNIPPALFASNIQSTPLAVTPHSLSRQSSPASPLSTVIKKRKASNASIIPANLSMTKIDTNQRARTMPHTTHPDSAVVATASSPFSASIGHMSTERDLLTQEQHMFGTGPPHLSAGPATPSNMGAEPLFCAGMNNGPLSLSQGVNQLFSAPGSAHPSRAPSPSQLRCDAQTLLPSRAQEFHTEPPAPTPSIFKIVPNEGSKCGGAEITILGSNFTNGGLEVYFGSQRAVTTTYWGPECLVCHLPASPVSGLVPVTIRHPGRRPLLQQIQPQPKGAQFFNYKDDDEENLHRLALQVLASQNGSLDSADFAKRIIHAATSTSGSGNHMSHTNGNGTFSRFGLDSGGLVEARFISLLDLMDLNTVNLKRSGGQTMLHLACSLGYERFSAALLLHGANMHIPDNSGFTALHMAAMNNHTPVVRLLVTRGAARDVKSYTGLTPMDLTRSRSVIRYLQLNERNSRSQSVDLRRHRRASSLSSASMYSQQFQSGAFEAVAVADDEDSFDQATTEGEESDWSNMRRDSFSGLRRPYAKRSSRVEATDDAQAFPIAAMAALREQFAQIQQSMAAMHFPNLAQFQMPNIDMSPYQAYWHAPVMQRISSLVPNLRTHLPEPRDDHTSSHGANSWENNQLGGNKDAPPAYEEIFPQKVLDAKQSSAAQAAAEADADAKCTALFDQTRTDTSLTQRISQVRENTQSHGAIKREGPEVQEVRALLQLGRKQPVTKEQQETLQREHAQRLKAGSNDTMLWFVWIPILVLVLGAMLWSGASSFISGTITIVETCAELVAHPRDISNRVRTMIQEVV